MWLIFFNSINKLKLKTIDNGWITKSDCRSWKNGTFLKNDLIIQCNKCGTIHIIDKNSL